MLQVEGWTDVGNDPRICKGNQGQPTCHTNANTKESRIDFIITNQSLTPAVRSFHVDSDAKFPTHKPIQIRVATSKLRTVTNQLRKPTNFATLFQNKLDQDIAAKQEEADKKAKEKDQEPKKVDTYDIRKEHLRKLHTLIDKHLENRKYRLMVASDKKNTTMQWDLIAAAVEEAIIEHLGFTGKEAKEMRGRSKVTFQKVEKKQPRDRRHQS